MNVKVKAKLSKPENSSKSSNSSIDPASGSAASSASAIMKVVRLFFAKLTKNAQERMAQQMKERLKAASKQGLRSSIQIEKFKSDC